MIIARQPVPVLLRAARFLWRGGPASRSPLPWRVGEKAAAFLFLGAAANQAFRLPAGTDTQTYFIIPPLLWAALRFGPRGSLFTSLLLTAITVLHTTAGTGPFGSEGGLPGLGGFLAVTSLCSLALASVVEELRRARGEAAENRNRLETLLRRMPAVLWTVDREMRFTFAGGTLVQEGDDYGKLLGVSLYDFFGTKDPAFPALAAHHETLAGRPADYRQNWKGIIYQCHVEPLRNAAGEVVGAVGVAQDVTRELEAEEDHQRGRKMEALSRLASRTAHDFNNSLTAILGYCDLLLGDLANDDPKRADVRSIERAALRASDTAERLTVFSRHHINDARPVDVNALIQEADPELGDVLGSKVARVYRLEPGLPLAKLDAGQLREVLRRLAANAREAMPEGGRLVIATQRRSGPGADAKPSANGTHLRITVHDEGPGLSEEARAHIFEPYFSTRSTEKDKGLGLAVCYGLVRQNEGVITFQSALGKGTAFHMDFPLWTGGPMSPKLDTAGSKFSPHGDETILLVEDEEEVRLAVGRVLESLGYTVLSAGDGREALRYLESREGAHTRLLLSDVVMPGMNGVDLAKQVHARRPDIRRLLMSGYAEKSLLADGTLPPGTSFLQKPFAYPALARRIREILDVPSPSSDLRK